MISPHSSGRKMSRGTATLGASKWRSRSGSRSGSGSRSRHRRLQGERSGRSGGGNDVGREDEDDDNNDYGNIGDDEEDGDYGGGEMKVSNNCNRNVRSADSGMRRLGKGTIPIPVASANSPSSLLPPSSSASMPVSSFPTTAESGEEGGGGGWEVLVGGGVVVTGGGYMRGSVDPSPAGDAPVLGGVDSRDADANEDGGGAVVRSVGGNGGRVFYSR